jgi:CHAT domain-containing protein
LLLHVRRDDAAALALLELAARGQALAGDRRSAALTQLLTGSIQSARGDTAAARQTLQRAQTVLRTLGDAVGEAAALGALADLTLQRGSTLLAESIYRHGLNQLGTRRAPDVQWQLHAGLGDALRSRGALGSAAVELRAAIAAIEQVSTILSSEERRAGFLADKWEVYATLARTENSLGHEAEAFAASERLRARQLLDLMARGRIARPNQISAREQDLRRRITDLTQRVEAADLSSEPAREPALATRSVDAAREQLDQAQQAYARLLLELRERDPAYARLVSGESVSWRDVAARLTRNQAMLEYLLTDSTALVFVITRDAVSAIDLDVDRKTLSNLVDFARRTMDRPASPASDLWRPPLRRLYQYLIEPVDRSGLLKGKRELVIVPHGELHFLSFATLLASQTMPDRFLVERFDLSYAPSASLWVRLGQRAANRRRSGVLALAPRVERLAASRSEVAAIREINGRKTTVLMGSAASERYLVQAAPAQAIIHLATFGVLNKHNPLFSYVELAAGGGSDGRLEVHEVFGLDLHARLVVLSACQTALGSGAMADVPPGDDWVGLVQSFLYAGAAGVLASLWPVDDRATAQLMERFHRKLHAHGTQAAALAQAQRAALHDPRTAHPFYWAGFVLTRTHAEN